MELKVLISPGIFSSQFVFKETFYIHLIIWYPLILLKLLVDFDLNVTFNSGLKCFTEAFLFRLQEKTLYETCSLFYFFTNPHPYCISGYKRRTISQSPFCLPLISSSLPNTAFVRNLTISNSNQKRISTRLILEKKFLEKFFLF